MDAICSAIVARNPTPTITWRRSLVKVTWPAMFTWKTPTGSASDKRLRSWLRAYNLSSMLTCSAVTPVMVVDTIGSSGPPYRLTVSTHTHVPQADL